MKIFNEALKSLLFQRSLDRKASFNEITLCFNIYIYTQISINCNINVSLFLDCNSTAHILEMLTDNVNRCKYISPVMRLQQANRFYFTFYNSNYCNECFT